MDLTPFTTTTGAHEDRPIRHDGWSRERKARFLDRLAACGNVRTASAAAGMSRDSAYRLRRRDAAFARGWDAALLLSVPRGKDVLADKATEGIEEDVWYRGELVGTRRRFDARLLLAHIARLEKLVAELPEHAAEDAARFDELVAAIGGEAPPEHIAVEDEPLPLDRDSAVLMADQAARDRVREEQDERRRDAGGGARAKRLNAAERAALAEEESEAAASARAEAEREWDAWAAYACEAVDNLTGPGEPPAPGLPGAPLPEALSQALAVTGAKADADEAENGAELPAFSSPSTVSNVSCSALARGLAGPATGVVFEVPRSPLKAPRKAG